MAFARFVIGISGIALTLTVPGLVRAQTCTIDADCSTGMTCQDDETPATPPSLCYADSAGNRTCEPAAEPALATKSCQLAPCATDLDCGTGMACYVQTITSCSGGAPVAVQCDPDTGDCPTVPMPEPETCTDTTLARCAYQWMLPCNADADCGAGFTCKPNEVGMCSGSAGEAGPGVASGGDSAGPAPATGGDSAGTGGASGPSIAPTPADFDGGTTTTPSCTIVTSFPGYCQAQEIACATEADCPSTWTCETVSTTTITPTLPVSVDDGAEPMPPVVDPNEPVVSPEPSKACLPPGYGAFRGNVGGGSEDGTWKAPTPALASPDGGATIATNTPPTVMTGDQGTTAPGETAAGTSGGCSVAGSELAGSSPWLLGVFAALGLLVARRRGRSARSSRTSA